MLAAGLYKPLDQAAGQRLDCNRRHQPPAEALKASALRKFFSEVAAPSGKGWPGEPEECLQTAGGVAAGAALAKCRDHPEDRGKVDPPTPEEF